MTRTLDGITVLDFSDGAAAALATMFLSDHGARVIRVIDKGVSPIRDGGFVIWDRGKECITLDLNAVVWWRVPMFSWKTSRPVPRCKN